MRAALVLTLMVAALPAAAVPQARPGAERLQADYRDEQVRVRRLRADAHDAGERIADLDRRIAALPAGSGDRQVAAQRARLRALGAREGELAARQTVIQSRQTRLLSSLQLLSRDPPPPLLVPSERAVDTVRATILMRAATPALAARAETLNGQRRALDAERRRAALDSEQLFTADSRSGDQRSGLEAERARQTSRRAVALAEAEETERGLTALRRRLDAVGAAPPAETPAPVATAARPAGRDRLTPPVEGAPARGFGRGSSGWSWRGDGLAVRAPAEARVLFAGPLQGWGEVVILDLGPGWRGVVSGLETVEVRTGARVAEGQALGRGGEGGEVRFELRRDERPVDPTPWLR